MSDLLCWRVVGGADKGGILVRIGKDLASAQEAERLSTGAIVKQLALEGDRLNYERLEGTGPSTGWVSLKLKDKELLVKHESTQELGRDTLQAGAGEYRVRWAINIDDWNPQGEADGDEFQYLLSLIEPEEERKMVMKYKHWADKKRALTSRLLMRQSSAKMLGQTSFENIKVLRTKGKKPYLASPLPPENEAPNWNANPSHEGSWVVCASEPHCVCGIDVAELRRLKPNGEAIDFYTVFRDQLTPVEWDDVKTGRSLDDQYEVFSRYWSAKEAFTKARGDGMGFPFSKCEFHWSPLQGFPEKTAYEGTLKVEGELQPFWRLIQHKLPTERPHWVTVARGPLTDIIDANGDFTRTLRKKQNTFSTAAWKDILKAESPNFEILSLCSLVPPDAVEGYLAAGGSRSVSE